MENMEAKVAMLEIASTSLHRHLMSIIEESTIVTKIITREAMTTEVKDVKERNVIVNVRIIAQLITVESVIVIVMPHTRPIGGTTIVTRGIFQDEIRGLWKTAKCMAIVIVTMSTLLVLMDRMDMAIGITMVLGEMSEIMKRDESEEKILRRVDSTTVTLIETLWTEIVLDMIMIDEILRLERDRLMSMVQREGERKLFIIVTAPILNLLPHIILSRCNRIQLHIFLQSRHITNHHITNLLA